MNLSKKTFDRLEIGKRYLIEWTYCYDMCEVEREEVEILYKQCTGDGEERLSNIIFQYKNKWGRRVFNSLMCRSFKIERDL